MNFKVDIKIKKCCSLRFELVSCSIFLLKMYYLKIINDNKANIAGVPCKSRILMFLALSHP